MRRVHVGIVPGHVRPAQVVGKDNNLRDIKYEKGLAARREGGGG